MTLRFEFCDGAESLDLSWAFASSGGPANSATNSASGERNYLVDGAVPSTLEFSIRKAGKDDGSVGDNFIHVGFKIRPVGHSGAKQPFFELIDQSGSVAASLGIEADGDVVVVNQPGSTVGTVTDPIPNTTQYYNIEFVCENSATGGWELWIDGVSVSSGTSDFTATAADWARIRFSGDSSFDFRIDDIFAYTSDTTAADFNAPISDWSVEVFQHDGSSTETGTWSTGTLASVDERPPDGTTTEASHTAVQSWEVLTDTGTYQGPNGRGLSGTPLGAVYYGQFRRGNGASRPANMLQGNATGGTSSLDINASLTNAYQDFFNALATVGTAAGNCPEMTDEFEYGLAKAGASGGRDYFMSCGFCQMLIEADAVAQYPIPLIAKRHPRPPLLQM